MPMRYSLLIIFIVLTGCEKPPKNAHYQWHLPAEFPKPIVPFDNPMSNEKVALGRHLFYDKNLSANRSQSCASCHQQAYGFGENIKQSIGSTGQTHRRNAQALINVGYNKTFTWAHDKLTSLEAQILIPLFGEQPIEMGVTGNETAILNRFKTAQYQALTQQAYGDSRLDFDRIVKALASFSRSLISLNSPFDRYAYHMQDGQLTKKQLRGMSLFFSEQLECHHCHGGFNFTQSTTHERQQLDLRAFHNTGLYNVAQKYSFPIEDTGLYEITGKPQDVGRFRAPTLRNIELTAPYMHDGSIATLAEVIDFYAAGGRNISGGKHQGDGTKNPLKSQFVKGFTISKVQKEELLDFLSTLTDEDFINNPAIADPFIQEQSPKH